MRICIIADATSIHTKRWCEYFSKAGHEIHLITYEKPNNPIRGVNLHIVDAFINNLYLAFPFRHMNIMRIVNRIKPDLVHAQFITKFGFHGALLGFHPLVMSAWGSDVLVIPNQSKLLWHFTKLSLGKSDLIYAASEDIRNNIISNFKINPDKVKLNVHGVDTELFYPEKKILDENNKIVVCSNRNFQPVYSVETLIDAIPLIIEKKSNIRFMIIGNGPDKEKLKQRINDTNVAQYVDFIGEINHKEMPEYLNSCDIYVSTALSDGTPVSMLEAMACQKACIVTDVGGVKEWIENETSGILIPSSSPPILAEKILKLAKSPDERERLGNEAYKIIHDRGDWNQIMSSAKNDYEMLVKEHDQ